MGRACIMVERCLFLLLSLMGAVAIYFDRDLFYPNWIGPAMVGGPFVAWLVAGLVRRSQRHEDRPLEKEAARESQEERGREVDAGRKGPPEQGEHTRFSIDDIEEHADEYRREGILWLLAVFQREGRLVDFIQEDISPYDDAQIGAACREIHQGLRKALRDVLKFIPVLDAREGSDIEVDEDYDPRLIRLTGNLSGKPPLKGVLVHPGWRVDDVKLPRFSQNVRLDVISQAEIEV